MEIYAVKMGGLNDPVGFDFTPLLCSWKVRGNTGTKQQWAGIQIASDKALSARLLVNLSTCLLVNF